MTFLKEPISVPSFFRIKAKKIKNLQKNYSIFARFMIIYKENILNTYTFTKGIK